MLARLAIALCLCSLAAVAASQAALSRTGGTREFPARPEPGSSGGTPLVGASGIPVRVRTVALRARTATRPRPVMHLLARVRPRHTVSLRSRPGGPIAARMTATTEFGSPRVLGVARSRGRWLGVTTTATPNGRIGWVRADDDALTVGRTPYSLVARLSARTLELRRGHRLVRRFRVAVGRPGSATPTGRFAVTDKLAGSRFGPYYGCCILALSGFQPHPPAGWRGGNRLGIHGTSSPGSIGTAASAGCLRAGEADLRMLMRRVPLGAPVTVRR